MKQSKNLIQIMSRRGLSVILVILLVSVLFSPTVAAQSMDQAIDNTSIELISTSENSREYIVYSDDTKTTADYLVHEERITVNQNQIWKSEIYQIMPDGTVSTDVLFGKDSYWWFDSDGGLHIHIGPIDMGYLIAGGPIAIGAFGLWLAGPLGSVAGGLLGLGLTGVFLMSTFIYTNPDNSLDIYMDQLTLTLIPLYIAMIGSQIVIVRIGTIDAPIVL
jgi:hypothetical protein